MGNAWSGHSCLRLIWRSVIATMLNHTEELVKIHFFIVSCCRSMIWIGSSLAPVFDRWPDVCAILYLWRLLLTCRGQRATNHPKRLARRRTRGESYISILSLMGTVTVLTRFNLIRFRCPISGLKTGLLHHKVANCMQVTMAVRKMNTIWILIPRCGHFLLRWYCGITFLLLLLRVQQVLLEFLRIKRVCNLLGHLASATNWRLWVVGTARLRLAIGREPRRLPVLLWRQNLHGSWLLRNFGTSLADESYVIGLIIVITAIGLLCLHLYCWRLLLLLLFAQKILPVMIHLDALGLACLVATDDTLINFVSFGLRRAASLLWLWFLIWTTERDFFFGDSRRPSSTYLSLLLILKIILVADRIVLLSENLWRLLKFLIRSRWAFPLL